MNTDKENQIEILTKDIEGLQETLERLDHRKFDVDLYKYRRNYIFGTGIVDILSSKKYPEMIIKTVTSDRMYSEEETPQHFLYYLLTLVEYRFPELFEEVYLKYREYINMDSLYNRVPKNKISLDMSIEEMYDLVLIVYKTALSVEERLGLNQKIATMLNQLRTENMNEALKVSSLIQAKKKQLSELIK